jgi:hypothetical protein
VSRPLSTGGVSRLLFDLLARISARIIGNVAAHASHRPSQEVRLLVRAGSKSFASLGSLATLRAVTTLGSIRSAPLSGSACQARPRVHDGIGGRCTISNGRSAIIATRVPPRFSAKIRAIVAARFVRPVTAVSTITARPEVTIVTVTIAIAILVATVTAELAVLSELSTLPLRLMAVALAILEPVLAAWRLGTRRRMSCEVATDIGLRGTTGVVDDRFPVLVTEFVAEFTAGACWHSVPAAIATHGVVRLLHLLAIGHDDAIIMLGVLQIVFGQDRIAG